MVEVYDSMVDFWEEFIEEAAKQKQARGDTPNPAISALIGEVYFSACEKCHYSLKVIIELDTRAESKLYEFNRSADDIRIRRENSEDIF